jgi:hypoxanthine phosphoribosyltransferase
MTAQIHPDLARILISEKELQTRVRTIADQLANDYAGKEPVILIGILKGAFIFLADLSRALSIPHSVDFMAVSSYGMKATSTGAVRIIMDVREAIYAKHVIIVEDIVDTGRTLNYLYHTLKGRQPASLRTCVLLQKEGKQPNAPIDYLGFTIPDVWVVGYGLDYADTHRTLPFVAELKPEVYQSG